MDNIDTEIIDTFFWEFVDRVPHELYDLPAGPPHSLHRSHGLSCHVSPHQAGHCPHFGPEAHLGEICLSTIFLVIKCTYRSITNWILCKKNIFSYQLLKEYFQFYQILKNIFHLNQIFLENKMLVKQRCYPYVGWCWRYGCPPRSVSPPRDISTRHRSRSRWSPGTSRTSLRCVSAAPVPRRLELQRGIFEISQFPKKAPVTFII